MYRVEDAEGPCDWPATEAAAVDWAVSHKGDCSSLQQGPADLSPPWEGAFV